MRVSDAVRSLTLSGCREGTRKLILPAQCRFRVGNRTRDWRMNEAWVFDDTIEHEAWNDSDEVRVILIFDVWNPLLSEAERKLVMAMMQASISFNAS